LELWKHLRHRGKYLEAKRRSWGGRRKGPTIPNRISIHKRPAVIETKTTFGHWELAVFALHAFVEQAGVQNIKSITFDNGLENVCHQEIREEYCYAFDTYFCDPYCSWQKG